MLGRLLVAVAALDAVLQGLILGTCLSARRFFGVRAGAHPSTGRQWLCHEAETVDYIRVRAHSTDGDVSSSASLRSMLLSIRWLFQ